MGKQQKPGKIINFASESERRGEPMIVVYYASKAAVISITQSATLELIKMGIHVSVISPGVVFTPMWDVVDELYATGPSKKRNDILAKLSRLAALEVPEIVTVSPFSTPRRKAIILWGKPSMSTAEIA